MSLLKQLTGERSAFCDQPICENVLTRVCELCDTDLGIGFSQFNELLLQLGYDRVSHEFFQFLLDGQTAYEGKSIRSLDLLAQGVDRFRKLALLRFGNVKFGFKQYSTDPDALAADIPRAISEAKYGARHPLALSIKTIPGEDTYYLGYVVDSQIKQRLKDDPSDQVALAQQEKRKQIIEQGLYNQEVYLCSDHMDVYIATSMREAHEYAQVSAWTKEIFESEEIAGLNARWFDPTQAYCVDRIDKGLAEALMLKRARCTVYFAQESDTLGKDSELASTLAQGKPVIAYIPSGGESYVSELEKILLKVQPDVPKKQAMLKQLQLAKAPIAWEDRQVRQWLDDIQAADESAIRAMLVDVTKSQYDKRADLLKNVHPLGIQVHLERGIANGVLVVRNLDDCARIIRRVLLNELEFTVEEKNEFGRDYILLRETVSGSVFRVMTGDAKLTNSFWNFYLN
jgi:hypothetical protein